MLCTDHNSDWMVIQRAECWWGAGEGVWGGGNPSPAKKKFCYIYIIPCIFVQDYTAYRLDGTVANAYIKITRSRMYGLHSDQKWKKLVHMMYKRLSLLLCRCSAIMMRLDTCKYLKQRFHVIGSQVHETAVIAKPSVLPWLTTKSINRAKTEPTFEPSSLVGWESSDDSACVGQYILNLRRHQLNCRNQRPSVGQGTPHCRCRRTREPVWATALTE